MVVDDSAVCRRILTDLIDGAPGMHVVGTAADGREAVERAGTLLPDVVTLDVQMPWMNGLATLDALFQRRPLPVVMVSSLTKLGANVTLDALEHGALDYVPKPEYGVDLRSAIEEELIRKIRMAAGADVRRILALRAERKRRRAERPAPVKQAPAEAPGDELAEQCIAIGISTGGPPALSALFEELKPPLPPIAVVQHMPPNFTKPLAWRLNALSALSIKEAEAGDALRPNHVLIAPGGRHLLLRRAGAAVCAALDDGPPQSGHKPSADVLLQSAAEIYADRCLGVIMTGMGRDGADGCRAVRRRGGFVLGQDEASSDVYGMNKVAFTEGNVDRQFSLGDAAAAITREARRMRK
ncbi:MAG: chemotaxis response regulator protein-glutamate methylesterase [Pirellulales bacterium]|nr:chemotaxis response regulator protein-glutamate methylesterase [Pirellulales bacterium]